MKYFLLTLILIFNLQSLTKAEDAKDFEIEGLSIGESLLNYISKNEIKKKIELTKNHYSYLKDPLRFREVYFFSRENNFKTYQTVSTMFEKNDSNYTILLIRGMIDYIENLSGCLSKRDQIAKEIEDNITDYSKDEYEVSSQLDQTGKSITKNIIYKFNSGDAILLVCNNWEEKLRKKNNWTEGLSVVLRTNEVGIWLRGN